MNFTKLSLITALTLSSAIAGGNIEIIEKVPEIVVESATTVSGKLQAYYMTNDTAPDSLFDDKNSQLGTAVTLDVSHKFFDGLSANFSAVGFANGMNKGGYMEGNDAGGYMNVANLTATYGDTTFVAGRQLLDTPMLGGFDWLLAPGAFEAYTLVNKSISNLTVIGSYVTRWRANNAGDNFADLTDNNYAFGAVYANEALFDASVWYYNVDAAKYTQVYADAAVSFMDAKVEGQYIMTTYDTAKDASAYGVKVSYSAYGLGLYGAVSSTIDNATGFVGRDSVYTSSWNRFASSAAVLNDSTLSWKAGATANIMGISAEASYAGYGDEGSELDVILGYDATDSVNLGLVYTMTDYDTATAATDAVNALEVVATYKF